MAQYDLPDELVCEAARVGFHKDKREAVISALEAYIAHADEMKILELEGSIDFDEDGIEHVVETRSA